MSKRNQAPRRRVERVRSRLNSTLAFTDKVLHTCEDSKTLVRMLIRLIVYTTGTVTAPASVVGHIGLAPGGNAVTSASTTEGLDEDVGINSLLLFPAVIQHDITNASGTIVTNVDIDTKLMRKLRAGDEIHLDMALGSGSGNVLGVIDMWFKE